MASSSHPASPSYEKYPHPVEVNVRDFVPINLSNRNYTAWKTLMLCLTGSQGMTGFINGEISAPTERITVSDDSSIDGMKEMENPDYREWKKSDELLKRWIVGTIDVRYYVRPHVECLKTAKDMWERLTVLLETSYMAYPYPIEVNVGDFVPFKLSKSNYVMWRKMMLRLFENEGLLGFIFYEDNMLTPIAYSLAWKRTDVLVQSWIIRTINEDLLALVVDAAETARDMWTQLERAFASNFYFGTVIEYYYPYPVEVNVGDFVPIKLSRENYSLWRDLMLRLIDAQGLRGFISGYVPEPPVTINYQAWYRTDQLLQSWIIRTINQDLLAHVVDSKTARDMWTRLERASSSEFVEYPYPVEVNVGDFVPIKLSRENYSLWRDLMLRLIDAQGLRGFISGYVPAPPGTINYKAWKRTDQLLQSWILGTINQEEVLAWLVGLGTAHNMWTKLETKFNNSDRSYERSETERNRKTDARKHLNMYRPLHTATLDGDWNKAKELLKGKEDAVSADITGEGDTMLMVAVRSEKRNHFVKNVLQFMPSDQDLTVKNKYNQTSLHLAAGAGNLEAAKLLVDKEPNLPNISGYYEHTCPLHLAALYGHRNMVLYLLDNTKEDMEDSPFEGASGLRLVEGLVISGLYDIALRLLKLYPAILETEVDELKNCLSYCGKLFELLREIAMENSAFRSGTIFNLWQWLIYFCIPIRVKESTYNPSGGDIYGTMKQLLLCVFWKVAEMITIVPAINCIRDAKRKHYHAVELFRYICLKLAESESSKVEDAIKTSLTAAITSGIPEIVKVIISVFPEAIYLKNEEDESLFHIAILNRQKNIFKLICQFTDKLNVRSVLSMPTSTEKTGLDIAACLTSEQKFKLKTNAVGAALQMQLELQWFKEIEKLSYYHENKWEIGKKTPAMTFSETHKDLMKEGEKWLKDTASSCTIVAALIVTIVFAAAITVPGGNDGNSGYPILAKDIAFKVFIISDALALFSSASSLLMFLSILTSRYAEIDFLHTLPRRLITGLVTMFISIVSMMVAFEATLYLVFGKNKGWFFAPVSVISAVPVILFASWQFPLLWDMINSTYFGGSFRG